MTRYLSAALFVWLCLTNAAFAFPQTYDTDASLYFLQLSINGCTTPTAIFKAAINQYIIAEKAALNWGNQDFEYLLATTDSCTAATNLAQPPLYKITWTGSPTFTLQTGLNGDGATIYGDIGVNQNAMTRMVLNNAHIEAWTATNQGVAIGLIGSNGFYRLDPVTNKLTNITAVSGAFVTDTGGGTGGLAYGDRTNSSNINTGLNGAAQSTAATSASNSLTAAHIVICRVNAAFCSSSINELFVGGGAAMNSESSHYTDVRNLLLTLGVTGI